uniref:Uncharacterized protein n=1 Tax=Babesia bovis TaxID=5865 RepID=S6C9P7_BABBO|nr:hypothetical protein [Babesia bovis]
MWYILAFVTVVAGLPTTPISKPDLTAVEHDQELLIHDLQRSRAAAVELKDKLDKIEASKNRSDSVLNISNLVADISDPPVEASHGAKYTPPIIILLPEAPSEREKWEYAITLRCLGQPNFSPFDNIHNSKMLEIATIKGRTVSEIQKEIRQTEAELEQTRKELNTMVSTLADTHDGSYSDRTKKLHLSHNIKLVKHEISVLETKLERLHKRLNATMLFSKTGHRDKAGQGDDEEPRNDDEGEEDDTTNDEDENESSPSDESNEYDEEE